MLKQPRNNPMKTLALAALLAFSLPASATYYSLLSPFRIEGLPGKWEVSRMEDRGPKTCREKLIMMRGVFEKNRAGKVYFKVSVLEDNERVFSMLVDPMVSEPAVIACLLDRRLYVEASPVPPPEE